MVAWRFGGRVSVVVARLLLLWWWTEVKETVRFAGTRFLSSLRGCNAGGACVCSCTRNPRIWQFDDSGMSLTIDQVVTQLQQEVSTFKAQVADQTGMAEAVRAINNLATAPVSKDTPSLIDVKKNSLAKRSILNGGRRRRRHSLLV